MVGNVFNHSEFIDSEIDFIVKNFDSYQSKDILTELQNRIVEISRQICTLELPLTTQQTELAVHQTSQTVHQTQKQLKEKNQLLDEILARNEKKLEKSQSDLTSTRARLNSELATEWKEEVIAHEQRMQQIQQEKTPTVNSPIQNDYIESVGESAQKDKTVADL